MVWSQTQKPFSANMFIKSESFKQRLIFRRFKSNLYVMLREKNLMTLSVNKFRTSRTISDNHAANPKEKAERRTVRTLVKIIENIRLYWVYWRSCLALYQVQQILVMDSLICLIHSLDTFGSNTSGRTSTRSRTHRFKRTFIDFFKITPSTCV